MALCCLLACLPQYQHNSRCFSPHVKHVKPQRSFVRIAHLDRAAAVFCVADRPPRWLQEAHGAKRRTDCRFRMSFFEKRKASSDTSKLTCTQGNQYISSGTSTKTRDSHPDQRKRSLKEVPARNSLDQQTKKHKTWQIARLASLVIIPRRP